MDEPFDPDAAPSLSALDFLASSRHRVEILNALRATGSTTRRELRESVEASRSTVRRTLEGFLEREWVVATEAGYRVTAAGGLVAAEFDRLSDAVRVADEQAPLLRHLPETALAGVDPAWLDGGTLTVATEADPYAPAQRQTESLRGADRFRALLPSIELEGAKVVHERVLAGELEATVVLSAATAETVRSEPFAELFREQLDTGRLEVYVHEAELPMYLGLPGDESVEIGCENEQGIPQALLQSSDGRLREWGEEMFEEYVGEGKRLSERQFE